MNELDKELAQDERHGNFYGRLQHCYLRIRERTGKETTCAAEVSFRQRKVQIRSDCKPFKDDLLGFQAYKKARISEWIDEALSQVTGGAILAPPDMQSGPVPFPLRT